MTSIPLLVPYMPTTDQVVDYLRQIDKNRKYTNFGPLCAQFEARVAAESVDAGRTAHAGSVANCTLGIELALSALDLAPGSRVLLPSVTFVASATAVIRSGMTPVFADVDPASWALTPAIAREALHSGAVHAVLPVSTFGYAHESAEWDAFTSQTGVPVVIDAAGAFGNQRVGETTDVVFSFHATKSFGAAEGGAVVSSVKSRIDRIRKLSNFGLDTSTGLLDEIGTNAKMSEYHCALGLASFDHWEHIKAERIELFQRYSQRTSEICERVTLQMKSPAGVYPLFPVLLPEGCSARDASARLGARGIETRGWYSPPLHLHPALRDAETAGTLEVCENIGGRILGLPFFVGMTAAQIDTVLHELAAWLADEEVH